MPSLAYNKPRSRVSARVPLRVEDDEWYERAACRGTNPRDFELKSEDNPDQQPNVLFRAMQRCFVCPVRRDCVIDAMNRRDDGVIRGGIEFRVKMPDRVPCRSCGLPYGLETLNYKCTYCASIRKCDRCARNFPARYPWLKAPHCDTCKMILKKLAYNETTRRKHAN